VADIPLTDKIQVRIHYFCFIRVDILLNLYEYITPSFVLLGNKEMK